MTSSDPRFSGRVTLPVEEGMDDELAAIIDRLGADAVRNSDGTWLPKIVSNLGTKVYSTRFCARGDEAWALDHLDEHVSLYLCSDRVPALEDGPLQIHIMRGFFAEQVRPDTDVDVKRWWQVRDRTTGEVVDDWTASGEGADCVVAVPATAGHVYTVAFLAAQLWDTTQMYNYTTNHWENDPTRSKEHPFDVVHPATWNHVQESLSEWLDAHPEVDVVRFTTFFYHFTLYFNEQAKEKFVDWFGYSASVSVPLMEAFEAETGWQINPEDFIDAGYHNSSFRPPSQFFLAWIDFVNRFVTDRVRRLVEICHDKGREAMMFLGDNWIGTEPYGELFATTGLDAVVGSVGSSATCRMISDIPGVHYTEGRFLPYFFPDVFNDEGDPVGEANTSWVQARRAIVRKPLDRIGYGGYLSLANQYPEFMERIEQICQEFRDIWERSGGKTARTAPFRIGILNCWGARRTWMSHMVAHALYYKQAAPYLGVVEALAGLPFDIDWLDFDDIRDGVPEGIGVLINTGSAGTAFSGAQEWTDVTVQAAVRTFVARGGGFIGVGDPTYWPGDGACFRLSDVLGVDREIGWSLSTDRYPNVVDSHFITDGLALEVGPVAPEIVPVCDDTEVLELDDGSIHAAVHTLGKGRAVYLAGLPYTVDNSRLLHRAIWWAAGRDDEFADQFIADDPRVETACYDEAGLLLVTNLSFDEVTTTISGLDDEVTLAPAGSAWINISA
ncbi:MAG: 1,3-beta-galactosyl-N-acetylhexosamine phosphorylase [Cutibacterium avidum]|uniref:1,3-beta-galactosyl-N-acetylhexosamine phosphorylase n=1 Tax=Cutibacterium avidum TaxID=33010 RepID=UPI0003B7F820|nr:1,3-beta-galactosyl-N-acetylhexosamine phosphorylase [Cutibacterium avidum]ERS24214.1 1,3-beta-galactosyl-N-acetylhexosamine phosphorylase [Propionibacterium sp. KPL2005]ERS26166.1 1,3-beta-galactosyl-N-acetylhexosamine phosphorylase [Propionibacterium sp. KPL2000]MCG7369165.1 1,3-beta-galactosyl-N-acetylhexosamine phosphorylase [Cutibacterium avidum]MCO6677210.1 1,3-beta-galactosyl-N-acetylhexosamine phosphorylase [Cutibacterium avidum]MDU4921044.1 1,3-beta-galactosyl-N-acetylhexosamine ph